MAADKRLVLFAVAAILTSVFLFAIASVSNRPSLEHILPGEYILVDLTEPTGKAAAQQIDSVPSDLYVSPKYRSTHLLLRRVPAGSFQMGSPEGELGREPNESQHRVTITEDFYIGVFEVTQSQWRHLLGDQPSHFFGPHLPVEQVSWSDVRGGTWPGGEPDPASFLGRLRQKTGLAFDLPTEAQWEYACRAGTTTSLNNGGNLSPTVSDYRRGRLLSDPQLHNLGWYIANSGKAGTREVGQKLPNAWGLFDMHGNVWEWCLDQFGAYGGHVADPLGEQSQEMNRRVIRGSDWANAAVRARSGQRGSIEASSRSLTIGFRLLLHVLPRQRDLDLRDKHLTHVDWELVAKNSGLRGLTLAGSDMLDADLAGIVPLQQLQFLNLSGTQLSDDGLRHIGKLESLQLLDLSSTNVTDVGLASLASLQKLATLVLSRTNVTEHGLRHLYRPGPLHTLILAQTRVRDLSQAKLEDFPALQSLDLSENELCPESYNTLGRLSRLVRLNLNGVHVGDDALAHVASLHSLTFLALNSAGISDNGLQHIAGLRSLDWLELSDNSLSDVGMQELKNLNALRRLYLNGNPLDGTGLAELQSIDFLVCLGLSRTALTDQGLKSIEKLPYVFLLDVSHTAVGDEGIGHLHGRTYMQELNVEGTHISRTKIDELRSQMRDCTFRSPRPER